MDHIKDQRTGLIIKKYNFGGGPYWWEPGAMTPWTPPKSGPDYSSLHLNGSRKYKHYWRHWSQPLVARLFADMCLISRPYHCIQGRPYPLHDTTASTTAAAASLSPRARTSFPAPACDSALALIFPPGYTFCGIKWQLLSLHLLLHLALTSLRTTATIRSITLSIPSTI